MATFAKGGRELPFSSSVVAGLFRNVGGEGWLALIGIQPPSYPHRGGALTTDKPFFSPEKEMKVYLFSKDTPDVPSE
jgi:hypothetical protein